MQIEIISAWFVPAGFGGAGCLIVLLYKHFTSFSNITIGITKDRHAVDVHAFEVCKATNYLFLKCLFILQPVKAEVIPGMGAVFDQIFFRHLAKIKARKYFRCVILSSG